MRVTDGVVYLAEPLFGRTQLNGSFVLTTTWLDFTFLEKLTATDVQLAETTFLPSRVRVFIPLSNVRAVLIERVEMDALPAHVPILERI